MENLKAKTCCFTGHRDLPPLQVPLIKNRTEKIIRELYSRGVRFWGVGGAIGYDTLAAKILFKLREEEMPDIKVILVYPFDGFTNRWTDDQKADYNSLLPKYDKIVKVADYPSRSAYLKRDRHLADCSGYCICCCSKNTGGTAYTVAYAKKKGLTVFNISNEQMNSI